MHNRDCPSACFISKRTSVLGLYWKSLKEFNSGPYESSIISTLHETWIYFRVLFNKSGLSYKELVMTFKNVYNVYFKDP